MFGWSTYSATISFAEAQPREKAVNITQERTSIFFRPYISLSFEMQTANPRKHQLLYLLFRWKNIYPCKSRDMLELSKVH